MKAKYYKLTKRHIIKSGSAFAACGINYGDGSPSGTVTQFSNVSVTIVHTYQTTGHYLVTVVGTDNALNIHAGVTNVDFMEACPPSNVSDPSAWVYINGGAYAYKMEHWLSNTDHHFKVRLKLLSTKGTITEIIIHIKPILLLPRDIIN